MLGTFGDVAAMSLMSQKGLAVGEVGILCTNDRRIYERAIAFAHYERMAWRLSKSLNGGGIMANWGCYVLDYVFGLTGWSIHPERVLA